MGVELVRHESALLRDNPLGDPAAREIIVILPPSYETAAARRYPVIMLLAGYSSTGAQLMLNRAPWQEPLAQRLEANMRSGALPEAIFIAPDCFTRYGGAQYLDSPALGRYQSYLADEIIPFIDARFRTLPRREARAVVGKSSGGYGALMMAMLRPDVAAVIASHAGDGAFELSYLAALGRTRGQPAARRRHRALSAMVRRAAGQEQPRVFDHRAPDVRRRLVTARRGAYGYGRGFDFR